MTQAPALGPLLQLYRLATSAHAACAALLPQIAPLPGRMVGGDPCSTASGPAGGSASSAPGTGIPSGHQAHVAPSSYFRALQGDVSAGREQQERLPDLLQLAQACGLTSSPALEEDSSQQSSGEQYWLAPMWHMLDAAAGPSADRVQASRACLP